MKKKFEKARLGEENSESNIEGYILLRSKQANMRELPSQAKGVRLKKRYVGLKNILR